MVTAKQKQLEESLMTAELSPTPDGYLRWGNQIMLLNHQAKAYMCANPYEKVQKGHEAWMITTSPNANPCVRNVFQLERADEYDGFEDGVVHYGQNFRCAMAPFSKIEGQTYMHSELVTSLAAAKFSRHQEVTAYSAPSGETLWQILHPDNTNRFETEGEPVPAGDPVVLRHVATGSFLASDEIPYNNIFGLEFEVHCYPYFSLGKTQNMCGEKKGEITGDYALRRHGLPNVWSVVTATHGQGALEG
jgi:hypothetical protein